MKIEKTETKKEKPATDIISEKDQKIIRERLKDLGYL